MSGQPRRLTYVPDGFPHLSESFVIGEMWLMLQRGHHIAVEPMRSGDWDLARAHERLGDLEGEVAVGQPGDQLTWAALPTAWRRASTNRAGRRPSGLARHVRNVRSVLELVTRIEASAPELIINHFGYDNAVASAIAARRLGVPLIIWIHGSDFYTNPHRNLLWFLEQANVVLVQTEYGERSLRGFGVKNRIVVSNLGVNMDRFEYGEMSSRAPEPTLICVARLGHNKNHERLLRIFAGVRAQKPDAVLQLVGPGPKREALEVLAADLGLDQSVQFLGGVSKELPALMRSAWLKVLTSDAEALGIVLMEAAASGLPAVASAVGGIPEIVVPGETGLLIDFNRPGSEECATAEILALLDDPSRREAMGVAARARAEDLFDEQRHVDVLESLIDEFA